MLVVSTIVLGSSSILFATIGSYSKAASYFSNAQRNLRCFGSMTSTSRQEMASRSSAASSSKVVIVGAGASGLATGHALVTNYGLCPSDIVILEARDRIGGRIHTIEYNHNNNVASSSSFPLDLGAAWLHGTGFDWQQSASSTISWDQILSQSRPMVNPMMELLISIQETTENNHSNDLFECSNKMEQYLHPVFHGNPWMRPKTILHRQKQLGLYVAGRSLLPDEEESMVVQKALQKHFAMLRNIHRVGTEYFEKGNGYQTSSISLAETIQNIRQSDKSSHDNHAKQDDDDDDSPYIEALIPFYLHLIECWYGCSASELRLCDFLREEYADHESNTNKDDELYVEEGDFYGPHCTMKQGMETLLQPMLKCKQEHANKQQKQQQILPLESRVFLNQEVTQIVRNQDHTISVHTSGDLTFHTECCVVTLPAGCLKAQHSTLFQPQLSLEKQEAISMTKMGSYKKVFLTFDRIFWPSQPAFLGMVRRIFKPHHHDCDDMDPLGNCLLFDNLWASRGIPCIEAVLFGKAGTWATNKTDLEIRDAVLNFMKDSMGQNDSLQEYCQSCHVTRWEEDPYSRGAYSSVALNALERHVEELRRPEWDGTLIFAGEATISQFEGSVHAALISGRNAAEKVNAMLNEINIIDNVEYA